MAEIKTLELIKTPWGKKGKFRYQVMENNVILAERISAKDYIACYVYKYEYLDRPGRKIGDPPKEKFDATYFFSRMDLIGKGDSRHFLSSSNAYAVAYLKEEEKRC